MIREPDQFTVLGGGKLYEAGSVKDAALLSELNQYRRGVASRYRPLTSDSLDELPAGKLAVTPKVDGELWFAVVVQSGVTLIAPNGRALEGEIPVLTELSKGLKAAPVGTVVAGELFALASKGRPRVGHVARALSGDGQGKDLGFVAFDLVSLGANQPVPAQWPERHEMLSAWLSEGKRAKATPIKEVIDQTGVEAAYAEWVDSDKAEGLVIRSPDARIFKVKPSFSVDCVVVGFTERAGGVSQVRSLLLGLMRDDESIQVVGAAGTVGSAKDRETLFVRLSEDIVKSDYRAVSGSGAMYRFVVPNTVIEVKCTDIQSEDIDGMPIRQWLLKFDGQSWARQAEAPGATLLHPAVVRIRDDKSSQLPDIRFEQLADRVEITASQPLTSPKDLPKSRVIRREVYTKETKGVVSVRKLLVWATNKPEYDSDYPPYVVSWTDYSPGRKAPLAREVRPAPSEQEAFKIADSMVENNIKKGWVATSL